MKKNIKKSNVTLESLDQKLEKFDGKLNLLIDNTEKFQSLVVKKFARVDEQFAKVDEKFARIDEQFAKVDEQFAKVDEQFAKVDIQFKEVNLEIKKIHSEIALIHRKLDEIESRMDKLEEKVRGQGYFSKELDDMRHDLNKMYEALQIHGIKVDKLKKIKSN